MSTDTLSAFLARDNPRTPFRVAVDLFLVSLLVLFLELACIRWFPAHVLFLTFFTNTVLLASFLGMSVGCLAAGRSRNYLTWTPGLLTIALVAAHSVEYLRQHVEKRLDVGHQGSPQLVFFGTEWHAHDLSRFVIPMEVLCGFFFLIVALAFVGPGQELGRALKRVPNRLTSYTINILGSMTGIVLFAAVSWFQLSPFWWFLAIVAGLGYFLAPRHLLRWAAIGAAPVAVLWLAALNAGPYVPKGNVASEHLWSPYYRIDYDHAPRRIISVNLIGHQQMFSREHPFPAYALPHTLNRDAGAPPFRDVLIIGAGSGNDVSLALQWGASHVDAVEIDPVIQRLGAKHHPDQPYSDPRVQVHIQDGRNFLRTTRRQYDLIVYALVDSLVLHSSYSSIRLESYLFTRQAFTDVRRCLQPDGLFVMYNNYRQGWIVGRLHQGLTQVFGVEPLVLPLPYRDVVKPDDTLFDNFTMIIAGNTERLRKTFAAHPVYQMRQPPRPDPGQTPNGFTTGPRPGEENQWIRFGLAKVVLPSQPLQIATDDWPFLYLRAPMIPNLSLRGMGIMGGVGLVLLLWFLPKRKGASGRSKFDWRLFFLGAGFMLVETKAVVHMALLFGSTWIVNSIVFFAVLVMIVAANFFVLVFRPQRLGYFYLGLVGALALNLMPLDLFLGMNRGVQIITSSLLVFSPIWFAGVIFAVSFERSHEPDRAFGANVAGALFGGLAEYTSMLLGFQYLMLVGIGFYLLSLLLGQHKQPAALAVEPQRMAA